MSSSPNGQPVPTPSLILRAHARQRKDAAGLPAPSASAYVQDPPRPPSWPVLIYRTPNRQGVLELNSDSLSEITLADMLSLFDFCLQSRRACRP